MRFRANRQKKGRRLLKFGKPIAAFQSNLPAAFWESSVEAPPATGLAASGYSDLEDWLLGAGVLADRPVFICVSKYA